MIEPMGSTKVALEIDDNMFDERMNKMIFLHDKGYCFGIF